MQILTGALSAKYLRGAAIRSTLESRELFEDRRRRRRPGIIELGLEAIGLKPLDLGDLLREPNREDFTADEQKKIFGDFLFPAPDQQTLAEILYQTVQGVTWVQRMEAATKDRRRHATSPY